MATRETLRSVLDPTRSSKRLDELSTARVIGKAAEQLHAAQQKAGAGKAVGPITPLAIVIAGNGEVKLELANRGSSLAYSAPEAAGGGTADRRSDVFSLGVVLWEALTRQRLFDAMNDAAVRSALETRDIKPPAEVNANIPAELSAITYKALARNPTERYGSAKAMAVEIEEFLSDAGYADSDDQIAAFVASLGGAAAAPSNGASAAPAGTTSPPPFSAPATTTSPPPIVGTASTTSPPPFAPAGAAAAGSAPHAPVAHGSAAHKPTLPPPRVAEPIRPTSSTSPPPALPKAPVLPVNPKTTLMGQAAPASAAAPAQAAPRDSAPDLAAHHDPATPHPASIVSLPQHRDSARSDVLAGWGWGTDAHEAIVDDDSELEAAPPSRKPMLYVIGGGIVAAMIVTIVAIGFGGSKSEAKKPPAPAAQVTAPAGAGSADLVMAANSGSQVPPPAPANGSADPAEPAKVDPGSAGSAAPAEAAKVEEPPPAEPAKTEPPPAPEPPKADPPKAEPPKPIEPPKVEPPKVAKADPPKPPEPKPPKADPPKLAKADPPKPPKADPPRPPKADPPRPPKAARTTRPAIADPFATKTPDKGPKVASADPPKNDASETAYHNGLQQFARGDTSGALASLRTSLANNPNYPPTWRGLGLVFEKLGEKDQARAAYKRYLQLAPSAGDADNIRGRLERLGS